jgi:hypothetical protein
VTAKSPPLAKPWKLTHACWLLLGAVLLGLGVRQGALEVGPVADDYVHFAMLNGQYPVARSRFDLFDFANGSRADIVALTQRGIFPWWSHPELRLSTWRPLSSALMWFDLRAFGSHYALYHLHSLFWWIALTIAVGLLWRRTVPLPVGALALALFALDEGHGALIAWIANRNASTSILFGTLALLAYVGWREERLRHGQWLAAVSFGLALSFGEHALTLLGYFFAHALFSERKSWRLRLIVLTPIALPTAAFLIARALMGYGSRHSGIYVDPFVEPLRFLTAALQRVPVLVADLFFALRSDYWTFGFPWTGWLYQHGLVDAAWLTSLDPWRHTQSAIGLGALLAAAAVGFSVLRRRPRSDPLWWMFVGAACSLLPVVPAFPSSRLLVASLIGLCPIFATFVIDGLRPPLRPVRALVSLLFALLQLGVPAWHTYTETRNLPVMAAAIRRVIRAMDVDDRALPSQRLVILSADDANLGFYLPLVRLREGLSAPERCWVLSGSPMPLYVTRRGRNVLEIELAAGQSASAAPFEQMFRSRAEPLHVGDVFDLGGMRAEVLGVRNGGFTRARFSFDRSLDDPSLRFLAAGPAGVRRFGLGSVGERVFVPGPLPAAFMQLASPQ